MQRMHCEQRPIKYELYMSLLSFVESLKALLLNMQAPKDAKQQIEDAMMAVMEKRHAMDDAAHGQSSNAA